MGTEIERKYLVSNNMWEKDVLKTFKIRQGYLSINNEVEIRVRTKNQHAFLTIKESNTGIQREELEYEIPFSDAEKLLKLCLNSIINKNRYIVPYEGERWEVDVYEDENRGLLVAEVELDSASFTVKTPPWIGEEITGIKKYYNSFLCRTPFLKWPAN